jgi:hypothetical protein
MESDSLPDRERETGGRPWALCFVGLCDERASALFSNFPKDHNNQPGTRKYRLPGRCHVKKVPSWLFGKIDEPGTRKYRVPGRCHVKKVPTWLFGKIDQPGTRKYQVHARFHVKKYLAGDLEKRTSQVPGSTGCPAGDMGWCVLPLKSSQVKLILSRKQRAKPKTSAPTKY